MEIYTHHDMDFSGDSGDMDGYLNPRIHCGCSQLGFWPIGRADLTRLWLKALRNGFKEEKHVVSSLSDQNQWLWVKIPDLWDHRWNSPRPPKNHGKCLSTENLTSPTAGKRTALTQMMERKGLGGFNLYIKPDLEYKYNKWEWWIGLNWMDSKMSTHSCETIPPAISARQVNGNPLNTEVPMAIPTGTLIWPV